MSSKRKPKLGQNFLVDDAACQRIADALGEVQDRTVVEIGPGHGAITGLLARRCRRLHCIELDPSLARELTFRFRGQPQVTIHQADVLETDLSALVQEPGAQHIPRAFDVVGNLPYYITSDILLHLFTAARGGTVRRAVVMMQREVAERVAAQPGSGEYGALSGFTQMHAQVTHLFTLPPAAFSPPPDVYSSVLRLEFAPRFAELRVEPESFNRFLRGSFAQKRKTLLNNLRAAGYDPLRTRAAWPGDLELQARAEAVSLEQMAVLYRGLEVETAASVDKLC